MINNTLIGIFWINITSFLISILNFSSRFLSEYISDIQVVFAVFLVSFLCIFPIAMIKRYEFNWDLHRHTITRSALDVIAYPIFYYAFVRAPTLQVSAIVLSVPITATILAVLFLKEKVTTRIIVALMLGFIGMLCVIEPWNECEFTSILWLVVLSISLWGIEDVILKSVAHRATPYEHTFYFFLFRLIFIMPIVYVLWVDVIWQDMNMIILFSLISGIAAAASVVTCTISFRYADLTVLAPFFFSILIYSSLWAYIFFGEIITQNTIAGIALILSGTVFLVWNERR